MNSRSYPSDVSGQGEVKTLDDVVKGSGYTPKLSFPKQCHSQIDAALHIAGNSKTVNLHMSKVFTLTTRYAVSRAYSLCNLFAMKV
jgi:hypothetical protein